MSEQSTVRISLVADEDHFENWKTPKSKMIDDSVPAHLVLSVHSFSFVQPPLHQCRVALESQQLLQLHCMLALVLRVAMSKTLDNAQCTSMSIWFNKTRLDRVNWWIGSGGLVRSRTWPLTKVVKQLAIRWSNQCQLWIRAMLLQCCKS